MSERTPSGSSKHSDYYDRAADAVPQFTVLNYGFSSDPENSVIAANEPEFYCLRLYEHTVRDTPLEGRDVLEVSCGRGGGANFVSRTFEPQRYVGVDLSQENVRLARERAARAGPHVRDRQRRAARSARCLVRRRHQHRGLAPLRRIATGSSPKCCACSSPAATSATRTAAGPTTTAREDLSTAGLRAARAARDHEQRAARAAQRQRAAHGVVRRDEQSRPTRGVQALGRRRRLSRLQPLRSRPDALLLASAAQAWLNDPSHRRQHARERGIDLVPRRHGDAERRRRALRAAPQRCRAPVARSRRASDGCSGRRCRGRSAGRPRRAPRAAAPASATRRGS